MKKPCEKIISIKILHSTILIKYDSPNNDANKTSLDLIPFYNATMTCYDKKNTLWRYDYDYPMTIISVLTIRLRFSPGDDSGNDTITTILAETTPMAIQLRLFPKCNSVCRYEMLDANTIANSSTRQFNTIRS